MKYAFSAAFSFKSNTGKPLMEKARLREGGREGGDGAVKRGSKEKAEITDG